MHGDFNLPSINWSLTFPTVSSPTANLMCDLVSDNFLHQMVVDPTRNFNLLDLVFTNQPDIVVGIRVIDNLPLTDHDAVLFTLNVDVPPQLPCKGHYITIRKRTNHFYKKHFLMFHGTLLSVLMISRNFGSCLMICLCLQLMYLFLVYSGEEKN